MNVNFVYQQVIYKTLMFKSLKANIQTEIIYKNFYKTNFAFLWTRQSNLCGGGI